MTPTPSPLDPYADWDAAYVLGSLPPSERHEYEQHVAGCARCRGRLAELSGLPGLLGLVDAGALDPAAPPLAPNPVPYVVFAQKVRRRRAGWAAAAAAAVLVLAGGTAAVTAGLLPQGPPSPAQTTATPGTAGVQLAFTSTGQQLLAAHGQARPEPWGTQLSWTCSYSASGSRPGENSRYSPTAAATVYELVVVTTAGNHVVVATWQAAPGSTVSPVATTTIPVASMKELLIQEKASPDPLAPLLRAQL